MSLMDRLSRAFNLFSNRDPTKNMTIPHGNVSYSRPDRVRYTYGNERSIIAAVMNRIANDVAQVDIKHIQLDEKGRFAKIINSDLNNCLTVRANKDQAARLFRKDIAESLLDEGCIAIVPVDTDDDPKKSDKFGIITMRTGKILEWYPDDIKVEVYNDRVGRRETKVIPKEIVAIIENPFYSVMNEPNSTLKRLTRKLNMLDVVDEQTSSGKLDIIIQLPYVVKSPARKAQAMARKKDLEDQLRNSKYGVAYTDGTEHITQLNRPAENNLMSQVEYLTNMLFSQLGITQSILDGTADEQTLNNYYDRTIEPILSAIVEELYSKFLTQNARTRGQSIMFFRNPFRLIPASKIAETGDKLIRNEILTKNEFRGLIGFEPSDDPAADELRNPNLNRQKGDVPPNMDNTNNKEKEDDLDA